MKIKCSVLGCDNNTYITRYKLDNKLYCGKHKHHMVRHKKILLETRFTPNKIIMRKDRAEIILKNKKFKEIARAIIDLDDVEKIKKYKWCFSKQNKDKKYVRTQVNGSNIFLQRFLMNPKGDEVTDHINRNILDYRKNNLRNISNQLNCFNTKIPKNNKSGVVGVYWNKKIKKWSSVICFKYNNIHLGNFIDKNVAVKIRKEAELKYFGEVIKR